MEAKFPKGALTFEFGGACTAVVSRMSGSKPVFKIRGLFGLGGDTKKNMRFLVRHSVLVVTSHFFSVLVVWW